VAKRIVILSDSDTWEELSDEIVVATFSEEDYSKILDGESPGSLLDSALEITAVEAMRPPEYVEKLKAERNMFRKRLDEVMKWVGVCPLDPKQIHEMVLTKELAADALKESP
jgi:hypothetical protein